MTFRTSLLKGKKNRKTQQRKLPKIENNEMTKVNFKLILFCFKYKINAKLEAITVVKMEVSLATLKGT